MSRIVTLVLVWYNNIIVPSVAQLSKMTRGGGGGGINYSSKSKPEKKVVFNQKYL